MRIATTTPATAAAPPPPLSRRAALRLGLAAAVLVPALAACGIEREPPEPEVDPLLAHLALARRDEASARAVAGTLPDSAAALLVIAEQRGAHAAALQGEVARAVGTYADGRTPVPSTSRSPQLPGGGDTPVTETASAGASPTLDEFRALLAESAKAARATAGALDGFRAGLLASISAACNAHLVVLLP